MFTSSMSCSCCIPVNNKIWLDEQTKIQIQSFAKYCLSWPTEFLNRLLEFLVLVDFLVVDDLFSSSLTTYTRSKYGVNETSHAIKQKNGAVIARASIYIRTISNQICKNSAMTPLKFQLRWRHTPLPPIWVWPNLAASLALASFTSWSWSIFPYNSYRLLYIY